MENFGFLDYFFWLILAIAFAMEAFALGDAVSRPTTAYPAANKQTKKLWTIILVVAAVIGFAVVVLPLQGASPIQLLIGILPVGAFIAAAIYLADVRPAIKEFKGRGGSPGLW